MLAEGHSNFFELKGALDEHISLLIKIPSSLHLVASRTST